MVYLHVKTSLTKHQLEKLAHAIKHDTIVTLKIMMDENGPHSLPLTKSQQNKLMNGSGHNIELSRAQINIIKKSHPDLKHGGFLPLITLIPLIASVLGGIGGVTGGIASAVSSAKQNNETARHNKAIEGHLADGLFLKSSGSGVIHKRGGCILTRDYQKLLKQGCSHPQIVHNLKQTHGEGVVSDFLSNIPLLGNLLAPLAKTIGLGAKKSKGLHLG